MKRGMIKIDGEKLLAAIEKRGYTCVDLSREMGYNAAFLSQSAKRRVINHAAAMTLERVYNIPTIEYEYEEPLPWDIEDLKYEIAPEEPKTITVHLDDAQLEMIMIDLQNMIKSAVYEGGKRAWQEV